MQAEVTTSTPARSLRHMVKHIPGQPTAVVKTMPGAGGVRMINVMYATAPRDGTTFGHLRSRLCA